MKVLFISSHLPSTRVPQAGQPIALQKLREYSTTHEVFLFVVTNDWEKCFEQEHEFDFLAGHRVEYLTVWQRIKNIALHFYLPLRVANRMSLNAQKALNRIVEEFKPELIHYEFTAAAGYYIPGYTSVLKEHDLTFISMMRRARAERNPVKRLFWRLDGLRMKKWELKQLQTMNQVIVLSRNDLKSIHDLYPEKDIRLEVPQGTRYVNEAVQRDAMNILYFGALNRFENETGLTWFLDKVWPLVLQKSPQSVLRVVGGGASKALLAKAGANVVYHGFVANPSELFSQCKIAVAPILSGAGIKIKVLDYLASDLHVVATDVAAEGIESERLMVAENAQKFGEAIIALQRTLI